MQLEVVSEKLVEKFPLYHATNSSMQPQVKSHKVMIAVKLYTTAIKDEEKDYE